jgi:protein-histidine pros-kinase
MGLVAKFNLVLFIVFALGFGAAALVSRLLLQNGAREDVVQDARMIMESAHASRAYTQRQVTPLLERLGDAEFLPQTVPAFGATEQFNLLHAKFPDFSYKEATLNPTNLRDRATDWEVDIVNRFRQVPSLSEFVGERDTPTGRSLYLAHPITIDDPACLTCHSTVDAAPKSMIKKYGPANGFGWQLHETVGAQIVSVPMTLPLGRANAAFYAFLGSLAVLFAAVFVVLNGMLMVIVVRPVTRLSLVADEVSLGKIDGPDLPATGKDEVARLAQSFNRMKKSVVHAIQMLDEEGPR